jgi:hypothetical protein
MQSSNQCCWLLCYTGCSRCFGQLAVALVCCCSMLVREVLAYDSAAQARRCCCCCCCFCCFRTTCFPCHPQCGYEYTCQGGRCKPAGSLSNCPVPRECQLSAAKACDPLTGRCACESLPAGTLCRADDAAAAGDLCRVGSCSVGGECVEAGVKVCPQKQCQRGTCNPVSGLWVLSLQL